MSDRDARRRDQDLRDAVEENVQLVRERVRLQDRIDELEMDSSSHEKEIEHLRDIAVIASILKDLICHNAFPSTLKRLITALSAAEKEKVL